MGLSMSGMGAKVTQVTLWNQSRKWKLVWSSKYWSRKKGLSPISSWPLCILQKILRYFNLCWWLCNSLTHKKYNNLIDRITNKCSWKVCVEKLRTYIKLSWIQYQENPEGTFKVFQLHLVEKITNQVKIYSQQKNITT